MESKQIEGELIAQASSDAGAIIDALADAKPNELLSVGTDAGGTPRSVLVVPDGRSVFDVKPFLDEYLTAPERRKGTAIFTDLESFIAHTNRFKDDDSVIFANDSKTQPSLTSVLDYHRRTSDGAPRFGQHRGHYAFPLSDEWKAWTSQNAREMTQKEFARFMEDRLVDVADVTTLEPGSDFATPSQLLELARGLAAKVTSHVRGSHDLGNGATEVMFTSEVTDPNGKGLPVPGAFVVAIPVFRRGDLYPVPVRLRYRVTDSVTWWYELARTDAVFEHAFGEALALVRYGRPAAPDALSVPGKSGVDATSLPVLRGTPE